MKNIDTNFIKQFESTICDLLPLDRETIHNATQRCVKDTNIWLNGLPSTTSPLNVRTYFVQRLSEIVSLGDTLDNEIILQVLLDDLDLRAVGEFITLHGDRWEVIWRKLDTNSGGVVLGLRNISGEAMTHIFFD
jgi:hypothetical protein